MSRSPFIKPFSYFVVAISLLLSGYSCVSINKKPLPEERKYYANEPDDETTRALAAAYGGMYEKLYIKSLEIIHERNFADYKKFIQNGIAYVVVHPAYFIFFHDRTSSDKIMIDRSAENFSKTIVDVFIEDYYDSFNNKLDYLKEATRRERDFIRASIAKERLIILVLPKDYRSHPEYPYRKFDEFARYINEVTGGAPSVLYIESEGYKDGILSMDAAFRLKSFIDSVGIKSIYVGGGYVGMCVKDFYKSAQLLVGKENTRIMKDVCTISPESMDSEQIILD